MKNSGFKAWGNRLWIFPLLVVMIGLTGCPPDAPAEFEFGGTYIINYATFREAVDVDGAGPILPTTDAKQMLYDLLDIYANCSSFDDFIFDFKVYSGFVDSVFVICPDNGLSSFIMECNYHDFGDNWRIIFDPLEFNDPGNFFYVGDIRYDILEVSETDAGWKLNGDAALYLNSNSTVPLVFDMEMESVVWEE